ncbi:glutathione S-transferase [Chitinivorax tropicus]|uniref:Glutathione S-transferase n=1 Tax=Chitinivorax tropicus TaxID=714531 RepID=A0A840MN23_9PROT|nr:glutathione S-transferase family protein [Chitinivorax tropicus]MBB5018865.1 glutathione S-transferase [Chitinivorax tropicus]
MFKLVIGNKNYSSWSLRPWFLLKHADIPFEEILIPLYEIDWRKHILKYSPTGKVPCLIDGKAVVWESIAICEYVAELFPGCYLLPKDPVVRAEVRSVSAEMHAGFFNMRKTMPMNVRKRFPGHGRTPETNADIRRITEVWNSCRERFGDRGPFLFGEFTMADAMFAPVCTRFLTYGVELPEPARAYMQYMLNTPAMKEWYAAALTEPQIIAHSEVDDEPGMV